MTSDQTAVAAAWQRLRQTLDMIAAVDPSRTGPATGPDSPAVAARYAHRNTLIYTALAQARQVGLSAGIGHDSSDPHPVVVYLELPTGQVSWHLPAHPTGWDGHSTEQKYQRIRMLRHRPVPGAHRQPGRRS